MRNPRSICRHLYRGLGLGIALLLVFRTASSGAVSTSPEKPIAQAPAPALVPSFPLVEVPMPSRTGVGPGVRSHRGAKPHPGVKSQPVVQAGSCASVTIGLKVLVIVAEPTDTQNRER